MRVQAGQDAPRYGMIFGNGAATRWLDHYYQRNERGHGGASRALADALGSIAIGGSLSRALFEPWAARVEIDGEVGAVESFSAMAAGGLPEIGLGFKPFFTAGQAPGKIHWISTSAGPLRMGLQVALVAMGLPRAGSALRHASAATVRVECAAPHRYTVDGDVFDATERFEVSAGPELEFVSG